MKIILKKEIIQPILFFASKISAKNTSDLMSSTVLIKAQNNKLTINAMNENSLIAATIQKNIAIVEDGKMCVSTHKLLEIISRLDGEIEIETKKNFENTIKSGKVIFTLYGYDKDYFPQKTEADLPSTTTIDKNKLINLVDKTAFVALTESDHAFFRGVNFKIENNKITAASTDGTRIVVAEVKTDIKYDGTIEFTIPKKHIELANQINRQNDTANVIIAYSENTIKFHCEHITIKSTLLNVTYPDYEAVIPQTPNAVFQINKKDLLKAISRVSLMSDDKQLKSIIIQTINDNIEISSTNQTVGTAKETVTANYTKFTDIKLACSSKLLAELLKTIDVDNISMQLTDDLSPILITTQGNNMHKCILMPMRM